MAKTPCGCLRVVPASALALALWACGGAQQAPAGAGAEPRPVPTQELRCDADGGLASLQVQGGTLRDHALACDALLRVRAFFERQGRSTARRVVLEFRDAVTWAGSSMAADERVTLPNDGRAGPAERVVGLFDPARGTVTMTSEATPWLRGSTYFGLPMTDELITTLLAHEIAHALSRGLYEASLQATDTDLRVQEECVAYLVQLATMDAHLRAAVLVRFPASDATGADAEGAINAIALGLAPETFGVICFRHFAGPSGGSAFLDRLYSGAFRPLTAY